MLALDQARDAVERNTTVVANNAAAPVRVRKPSEDVRAAAAPDVLRHNVTSAGGTTAAALSILMDKDALKDLIARAVIAAKRRSAELAG